MICNNFKREAPSSSKLSHKCTVGSNVVATGWPRGHGRFLGLLQVFCIGRLHLIGAANVAGSLQLIGRCLHSMVQIQNLGRELGWLCGLLL